MRQPYRSGNVHSDAFPTDRNRAAEKFQDGFFIVMTQSAPQRAVHDLYTLLVQVRGSIGGPQVQVGQPGKCRYCHGTGPFRKIAHTFPEALGNKKVVSLDECDNCNELFSLYDNALANSVSPFLTLGGTRGKGNKIRQTGRSVGDAVLSRSQGPDLPRITAIARSSDPASHASFDSAGKSRFRIPVAGVPFKARHAYKALSKMAFAILPEDEHKHYERLRQWLLVPDDDVDFPVLDVGMSFGSVGNAPPLVAGTLIKRVREEEPVPYIHFIFCAGSVCLQTSLKSDHMEDHIPPTLPGNVAITFTAVIGPGETQPKDPIRIEYSQPIQRNWSSTAPIPQPVQEFLLEFDMRTEEGRFTPVMRPE